MKRLYSSSVSKLSPHRQQESPSIQSEKKPSLPSSDDATTTGATTKNSFSSSCSITTVLETTSESSTTNRGGNEADDADAAAVKSFLSSQHLLTNAQNTPTQTLFPWRHDPLPLPRFQPTHPDHETYGSIGKGVPHHSRHTVFFKVYLFLLEVLAARQLMIPWKRILAGLFLDALPMNLSESGFFGVSSGWKAELSNGLAWAFQQSVAELIVHSFDVESKEEQVFVKDHNGDGDGSNVIDFDQKNLRIVKDAVAADNSDAVDYNNPQNDESMISSMLEPKLLELYRSAKQKRRMEEQQQQQENPSNSTATQDNQYTTSNSSNLSVRLQTRPISWKLENIHLIPLLTRQHVSQQPSLKGSLQYIFNPSLSGNNNNYNDDDDADAERKNIFGMMRELEERANVPYGTSSTTVVAQVSIVCRETFVVRDESTGMIVQGNTEEQDVTHLVRFEIVCTSKIDSDNEEEDDNNSNNEENRGNSIIRNVLGLPPIKYNIGSWVITDWDDLLDGNIWF